MSFRTWILIFIGTTGFVIWSYASFMGIELPEDYMQLVKAAVFGPMGLALREMGTAKDHPEKVDVPEGMSISVKSEVQK